MKRLAAAVLVLALCAQNAAVLGAAQAYAWTSMAIKGQEAPCHVCIAVADVSSKKTAALKTTIRAGEQEAVPVTKTLSISVVAGASPRPLSPLPPRCLAADAPPTPPPNLLG